MWGILFLELSQWMQWITKAGISAFLGWPLMLNLSWLWLWRHFRSSLVLTRNNVWFMCSKVNTKGFLFRHQMPAELFSALLVCCYLSLAFPPQGKFCEGWLDWQLKNATAEWGASQPDADIFQLHLTLLKKWSPEIPKHGNKMGFLLYLGLLYLWGCICSFIPKVHLFNSGIHPMYL